MRAGIPAVELEADEVGDLLLDLADNLLIEEPLGDSGLI